MRRRKKFPRFYDNFDNFDVRKLNQLKNKFFFIEIKLFIAKSTHFPSAQFILFVSIVQMLLTNQSSLVTKSQQIGENLFFVEFLIRIDWIEIEGNR